MNERIKELVLQSQLVYETTDGKVYNSWEDYVDLTEYVEKFAELIVGECITNIARDTANWPGDEGTMAYYQGVQDAVKSIRKHFGVEE